MKIAVTGANGFVGRHVLAELANYPLEIIPIVRHLPSSSLPESVQAKAIMLDIHAPQKNTFERMGRPDALIHLAWGGLPNYRSLHHFEQELPMQYQFLQGMIKSGLQSLVVAGTCFEYGMQSGSLNENMTTTPSNPYGFAKDVLRCQLEYLQKTNPFSLAWARLFYLYGEDQAENSLLPQLRKAVEQGDKIFNMSGGEQLRDYLPVTEVAKYLVSLAMGADNIGIVNICAGKPISVRNLVEKWVAENNWTINLNLGHYPYPDYEPMAFWGDRRKLDTHMEAQ
ncbi:NAD(P)-dependent oxidoreductase [Thiothrix sp.]|uniref:NAD-dependent epimerase/dehydratase family protein n=1 Tax=Thiothrix sp. TaxID=1032 RepID=UPI00257B1DB4|nr:NAD(P)-dependent oxidoreductase [Thiothrix sp.]